MERSVFDFDFSGVALDLFDRDNVGVSHELLHSLERVNVLREDGHSERQHDKSLTNERENRNDREQRGLIQLGIKSV